MHEETSFALGIIIGNMRAGTGATNTRTFISSSSQSFSSFSLPPSTLEMAVRAAIASMEDAREEEVCST